MPPYRLPALMHAVVVRDDIAFLDLASDYVCLVDASPMIQISEEGAVTAAIPEAITMLVDAGLAEIGEPIARRVPPTRPVRDMPLAMVRATGRQQRAAAAACVTAGIDLARLDLAGLVARAAAGRPSSGPADPEAVIEASAAFARLRVWSPVGGECLARSYLMLTYLRRLSLDADWIFGVRTWPFQAHCWLQAGETALDDDVERLTAYAPILVV